MKRCLIIGLGNFGLNVARTIYENGGDVLCVDSEIHLVQRYKDLLGFTVSADATQKEELEALQVKDFDVAIVSIGQDITASILITLHVQQLGIPRIIVRAISEDHGKVLEKLGITEIIYPEKDIAERVGRTITMKNALDYLPLSDEYSIIEIEPPHSFIGKTLAELKITSRFNCQLIGIKDVDGENESMRIPPKANDRITAISKIVVLGRTEDIEKMQSAE